jgi:hypothetical protein
MKANGDNILLSIIGALCVAAATVVAVGTLTGEHAANAQRDFQRAVGGFGLGPQVGLSHCWWQFDARLAGDDDPGLDSVAGLSELSPWHSIALFPPPSHPAIAGD